MVPKAKIFTQDLYRKHLLTLKAELDKGGKRSSVRKTRMIVQTSGEGR